MQSGAGKGSGEGVGIMQRDSTDNLSWRVWYIPTEIENNAYAK